MRKCYTCGSNKTFMRKNRNWREEWHPNHDLDNNVLCHKCYVRYFDSHKYHVKIRAYRSVYGKKRIQFKSERRITNTLPRTGICSKCGAITGINCERTSLHHEKYDPTDPLAHTIELCNSCHTKTFVYIQPRNRGKFGKIVRPS
jgi:hypothetical protein